MVLTYGAMAQENKKVYVYSGNYLNDPSIFALHHAPTPQYKPYKIMPLPQTISKRELKLILDVKRKSTAEEEQKRLFGQRYVEKFVFCDKYGEPIDSLTLYYNSGNKIEILGYMSKNLLPINIESVKPSVKQSFIDLALSLLLNTYNIEPNWVDFLYSIDDFDEFQRSLQSDELGRIFNYDAIGGDHMTISIIKFKGDVVEYSCSYNCVDHYLDENMNPQENMYIHSEMFRYSLPAFKLLVERFGEKQKGN